MEIKMFIELVIIETVILTAILIGVRNVKIETRKENENEHNEKGL